MIEHERATTEALGAVKLGNTLEVLINDLSEIAGNKARQAVAVKSSASVPKPSQVDQEIEEAHGPRPV